MISGKIGGARKRLHQLGLGALSLSLAATTMVVSGVSGSAWFGPGGHCDFNGSSKCIAVDSTGAIESPYKGLINLPGGTKAILDEMAVHVPGGAGGWTTVAGQYELKLLEDEGGTLHFFQTIDYTVNSA
ncbi:MAG TPA: hypothetical protein VG245_02240, partial [Candidatus Dormibacteraeota bacterium]|nr:hypothetical protein [Candidatus Dormibacteraeota bacterium]